MLGLKILFNIMMLVPMTALAAQGEKLYCVTSTGSDIIDTSYLFLEMEDRFRVVVRLADGAMPIESDYFTTVRIRDLKILDQRAEIFAKLPNQFILDFPKNKCSFKSQNSQLLWDCSTKEPGQLGSLEHEGLSFYVLSQKVESFHSTYHTYNVGLEFRLTYENLIGKDKFKELFEKASADGRRALTFRNESEIILRGMQVAFQNQDDRRDCYIPSHPYKGILDQISQAR